MVGGPLACMIMRLAPKGNGRFLCTLMLVPRAMVTLWRAVALMLRAADWCLAWVASTLAMVPSFAADLIVNAYIAKLRINEAPAASALGQNSGHQGERTKMPCFTPGQGPRHMRAKNRVFHDCKNASYGSRMMEQSGQPTQAITTTNPPESTSACSSRLSWGDQRGGGRKRKAQVTNTEPPRLGYFERQFGQNCQVHAWNNMIGRKDLCLREVLSFVTALDATFRTIRGSSLAGSYYTPGTGNYNYSTINCYLVHRAAQRGEGNVPQLRMAGELWGTATPAPHTGTNRLGLPLVSREAVAAMTNGATSLQVIFTARGGYGHAAAMRRVEEQWYWVDSERNGPTPIADADWPALTAGEFKMLVARPATREEAWQALPEELKDALCAMWHQRGTDTLPEELAHRVEQWGQARREAGRQAAASPVDLNTPPRAARPTEADDGMEVDVTTPTSDGGDNPAPAQTSATRPTGAHDMETDQAITDRPPISNDDHNPTSAPSPAGRAGPTAEENIPRAVLPAPLPPRLHGDEHMAAPAEPPAQGPSAAPAAITAPAARAAPRADNMEGAPDAGCGLAPADAPAPPGAARGPKQRRLVEGPTRQVKSSVT